MNPRKQLAQFVEAAKSHPEVLVDPMMSDMRKPHQIVITTEDGVIKAKLNEDLKRPLIVTLQLHEDGGVSTGKDENEIKFQNVGEMFSYLKALAFNKDPKSKVADTVKNTKLFLVDNNNGDIAALVVPPDQIAKRVNSLQPGEFVISANSPNKTFDFFVKLPDGNVRNYQYQVNASRLTRPFQNANSELPDADSFIGVDLKKTTFKQVIAGHYDNIVNHAVNLQKMAVENKLREYENKEKGKEHVKFACSREEAEKYLVSSKVGYVLRQTDTRADAIVLSSALKNGGFVHTAFTKRADGVYADSKNQTLDQIIASYSPQQKQPDTAPSTSSDARIHHLLTKRDFAVVESPPPSPQPSPTRSSGSNVFSEIPDVLPASPQRSPVRSDNEARQDFSGLGNITKVLTAIEKDHPGLVKFDFDKIKAVAYLSNIDTNTPSYLVRPGSSPNSITVSLREKGGAIKHTNFTQKAGSSKFTAPDGITKLYDLLQDYKAKFQPQPGGDYERPTSRFVK